MKGFRLRNIVALFLVVLMGASVLMAHVWKQNSYVRITKESMRLNKDRSGLRDSIALLEMQAGELRKLGRIEGLAKARFGLEYGNNPVLVYPESEIEGQADAVARRNSVAEAGKSAWPTRGL